MAVYSRLSLSAGGGIISTQQLAEQTKNTATILIGLGGTGVDCLRTIKTQVYTRLKPDDVNAVKPEYSHIRFLGVDTTEGTKGETNSNSKTKPDGFLPLDDTEFFSIANKNVAAAIANPLALQSRDELKWLEYEKIDATMMGDQGAGGVRQVGRFMLMDKAEAFLAKLQGEITKAKEGLVNPNVNIHIFAGLSGGTGSGCFLDICYMARHLVDNMGGGTTFGYCFLPDVNLERIPLGVTDVRSYIPKNGYAAMQEVDYCMSLPKNGGSFEQIYKGGKTIKWNRPPVDMCHLVCATDADFNVIANAYDYAMHVTAEYILNFLTQSNSKFDLSQHLANHNQMVAEANSKKVIGSKMNYCVIGASSASLPLKEINTYLASELFEKFSKIGNNTPTQSAVEELAKAALARDAAGIGDLYLSVLRELRDSAGDDYASYQDDWKYVLEYGNSDLVKHYTNQTAAKLNRTEANAKSLTTETNNLSLSARVRTELVRILKDVNRGPVYGYKMLSAAQSHNLLNIVDGLIAENTSRWNQEAAQADLRTRNYEAAKRIFETRHRRNLLDNDSKRFSEYEWFLMLFEQHKLNMSVYRKYDEVLTTFRKQIEQMTSNYYIKLSRVMNNLIETFRENRDALNSTSVLKPDPFSVPLMTIDELKDTLDKEVEAVNVDGMLDQFMALMIDNETEWIGEDENKISRLVNNFFVKNAFAGFATRSITAFLKDKYEQRHGSITDEQLTNFLYDDWMKFLIGKASPLFAFDKGIKDPDSTTMIMFLSCPEASAPVKAAARKLGDKWDVNESALTDRIFVMCSACGVPLAAYNNVKEYEVSYFADPASGRHYYEGKAMIGKFKDWKKLPSIMPRSFIYENTVAPRLKELIMETDAVYSKARELCVLDEEGYICRPDPEALENLKKLCEECKDKIALLESISGIEALLQSISDLKTAMLLSMKRTEYQLPKEGDHGDKDKIEKINRDMFFEFPAFRIIAEEIITEFEALIQQSEALLKEAEEKIQKVRAGSEALKDYCDALFTGVITTRGTVISYKNENDFLGEEIILSEHDEEKWKYADIPVYQGYLTYQSLESEVKDEIKKRVNARKNNMAPELQSSGQVLKDLLGDDRVSAWAALAKDNENGAEIVDFLRKLKERFRNHCLVFGIK